VVGDDEVGDARGLGELEGHARAGGLRLHHLRNDVHYSARRARRGGRGDATAKVAGGGGGEAKEASESHLSDAAARRGSVRVFLDAVKLDSLPEWVGNGGCSSCNCPSVHIDVVHAVVQLGAVAWGCSNGPYRNPVAVAIVW
jgi:hypothetical protein